MVLPQRIETNLDAPLATPSPKCLYCSLPARKQCSKCMVVYFCDENHQKLASRLPLRLLPVDLILLGQAWGTHKYRCGHSSSTFVQPKWLRWESDLFAESTRIQELLKWKATNAAFMTSIPLFPQELWRRMMTAKPQHKLLIDVLRGMCRPPIKPLDVRIFPSANDFGSGLITSIHQQYFWDMCCAHFKDKLSVDEGTEWRIAVRHMFRGVAAVPQSEIERMYANSGMYGYFLACQTRLLLRESSFPLPLQNQLLDAYTTYFHITVTSMKNETAAEARNISYGAFGNFIEMIRVLFQHDWRDKMDRVVVGRAMMDVQKMWPPDNRGWSFNDGSDERRVAGFGSWPEKLLAKKFTTESV